MITNHTPTPSSARLPKLKAWINVEEADDVCDALSGLHTDRLLAPKTDEEQVSSMQDDSRSTASAVSAAGSRGYSQYPKVPKT